MIRGKSCYVASECRTAGCLLHMGSADLQTSIGVWCAPLAIISWHKLTSRCTILPHPSAVRPPAPLPSARHATRARLPPQILLSPEVHLERRAGRCYADSRGLGRRKDVMDAAVGYIEWGRGTESCAGYRISSRRGGGASLRWYVLLSATIAHS